MSLLFHTGRTTVLFYANLIRRVRQKILATTNQSGPGPSEIICCYIICTLSMACDLEEVLFANVGSLVLFLFPILSMPKITSVEEAEMSKRLVMVMEPLASSLSSREPLSGQSRSRTNSL